MTPWADWNGACPRCGLTKPLKGCFIFPCLSVLSVSWFPLCSCAGIFFFPKVKWISYKQQRNWVSRSLGKLKKILEKNLMHGNDPFSCKTGLVAVLSRNGEKQRTCCWFFWGLLVFVHFSMIWEWAPSQLKLRYTNVREDLYLVKLSWSRTSWNSSNALFGLLLERNPDG